MREERQAMILEIVASEPIETQGQLLERLRERGVTCTQATVSRDIQRLHLVKRPDGQGAYRYAAAEGPSVPDADERLRTIFRQSVVSIDHAQNLVVVKTLSGLADAACAAIDHMEAPGMVGSLAGDDTVFLAMRDTASAVELCRGLRTML